MARPILVADLFCGAGGLSTGAAQAIDIDLGRSMDLVCANSWERAIETHRRMHPRARHYCKQVQAINPREAVPRGKLDLLGAAPTCTHHSRARGGRPTSDQQRMDPWHIATWATELKVDRILVENVPEFVKWGPVALSTGRPIKSKEGQYHTDWVASFERRGYVYSYKFLNCADYGDATTRIRYFGQFRRRDLGRGIRWPDPSHAREPRHDLLAPLQRWRSARECVDWSHRGGSIYKRKRPLSAKTLLRIYTGIAKFGWPDRYVIRLRRYLEERGIAVPVLRRADPQPGAQAFIDRLRRNATGDSVDDPVATVMLGGHHALVEPFVLAQGEGSEGRRIGEPLPTIPCGGAHALIAPYYGGGSGLTAKSVEDPLPTATALARFGLIMPVTHSDGSNRSRGLGNPLPTLTTANRGELAFITSAYGERDGQLPRVREIDDPTPTIAAQGYVPLVNAGDDDDILYRMLQPPELARATSFPDDYAFAGNKTEVTRQIGNAVPIRMARALVGAALWDMAA